MKDQIIAELKGRIHYAALALKRFRGSTDGGGSDFLAYKNFLRDAEHWCYSYTRYGNLHRMLEEHYGSAYREQLYDLFRYDGPRHCFCDRVDRCECGARDAEKAARNAEIAASDKEEDENPVLSTEYKQTRRALRDLTRRIDEAQEELETAQKELDTLRQRRDSLKKDYKRCIMEQLGRANSS